MKSIRAAIFAMASLFLLPAAAVADTVFQPGEWQAYMGNFVGDDGRVIDTGNANISHSEGQGYGLILAALADDPEGFERIWKFTATELMVRPDGLAAWRWEPDARPHVTDMNNATDGDMLIAYGLLLASKAWDRPDYLDKARTIVATIGKSMLRVEDGLPVIVPGAAGFLAADTGNDGTVLNPSYWVFEVFSPFAELDPVVDWRAVEQAGLDILRRSAITPAGIPADWILISDGAVRPAPGFPPEFGYNGLRIPLYLIRAGADPAFLKPFRRNPVPPDLAKVNVVSGKPVEPITEPGYRLILAGMDCLLDGTLVPEELRTMTPSSYYSATLQLLLLDHFRRNDPRCLGGGESQP